MGHSVDHYTATGHGRQFGFTLIELVVTITLLGIVLASAALLGRYATEPIRSLSEAAYRAREINCSSYISRYLDDIAVVISWSDSTLTYLDECGTLKKIYPATLGRTVNSDRAILRFEVSPEGIDTLVRIGGNTALNLSPEYPDALHVRVYLLSGSSRPDTLCFVRAVPFLPFQR